ncbi:hypothetical protein CHLRE_03g146147v5 [Chlamydomonas reinhardtii]|uniref:Uncharacterized protein n=1 Tax=Chlamydomonas reinhardtii TaxID=3055 RepID=A0A2K3DVG2_CHLRE|nr:uncharacterized protein CHLRE_03g146147v5 [Chlamydomonas reinhardtii]PNW84502.1 hypothetical protein CHLRE_03g146147v5 [Chlamydomonas reinhardtii]
MMLTRKAIAGPGVVSSRSTARAGVAPVPLQPRLRSSVVRRFKENNEETDLEMQRRREMEEVRRRQEEAINKIRDSAQDVGNSAKQEIKKDVRQVVDTVEASSAGKGYSSAIRVPIWMPAFTRRREVFMGRIAMVAFAVSCGLEIFTADHLGPIRQVQLWSGLDESTVVALIMGIIAYNVLGGLGPWSPTFAPENLRDVARRPRGPPSDLPAKVGDWLGISGWGFTKRNEVFHGRLAMMGFLFAFINEMKTGRGALGQVAGYLGIIPDAAWYSACLNGFIVFSALMLGASILFPSRLQGSNASEDDIY